MGDSLNFLLLCAGPIKRAGWVTLDANPEFKPDILASIPPLPKEVTGTRWHTILWSHGIGSLYPWQAEEILPQLRAALADEGVLVLEQPNARAAAGRILEDPADMWWMFGRSYKHDALNMNHWAYTPETLAGALRGAGFTRIEALPAKGGLPERDFRMEARR